MPLLPRGSRAVQWRGATPGRRAEYLRRVEHAMADVWFVLLTVALFAVIGLVARGVERL